jgi:hypothetical protein
MLIARVFDSEIQRSFLLWRYITADHCGCYDGLHVPSPKLHDESAVRIAFEEGQFQNLLTEMNEWQKTM